MSWQSVRELLDHEMKKRLYITQHDLTTDDLFEGRELASWIKALFSDRRLEVLDRRVDTAPPIRLAHAAATYLLGIALREQSGIGFDSLPRIFSVSAAGGDAFYFFWSGICLCHDFGCAYEECREPSEQKKMLTENGRQELLRIKYDLLSMKREDYPGKLNDQEAKWVEQTLFLAERYNHWRLEGVPEKNRRIDHGIAGGLILYDALRCQIEMGSFDRTISGEIGANACHPRFEACCLLMACTILRHNMWTVSDPDKIDRYKSFGLDPLCAGPSLRKVGTDRPEEQMLFLLDLLDTIDPVKNLYVRAVEQRAPSDELDGRRTFLLDKLYLSFDPEEDLDYRWFQLLPYHQMSLRAIPASPEEQGYLKDYRKRLTGLSSWLETKEPDLRPDGVIVCYYPRKPSLETTWPKGITDREIDAICLYEGSCIPGKAGRFYQLPNAYQTFNLLMMPETEGERVRVCIEGQNPDGIYIRQWRRTLEVFTDIFRAQCRYLAQAAPVSLEHLFRVDRELNMNLLRQQGHTFAFTSVSKARYLPELLKGKQNPVLLDITAEGGFPYVDLAEILNDNYVHAQEAEVLIPPFVTAWVSTPELLTEEQLRTYGLDGCGDVRLCRVRLNGFCCEDSGTDPYFLIDCLEQNREKAAAVLEAICETRNLDSIPDADLRQYVDWKRHFFLMVGICFQRIWDSSFRN
ncbi:hypothetical protein AALA83_15360 [Oscillospiraceae bacterium 44-5]